jgi:hypothetical protein
MNTELQQKAEAEANKRFKGFGNEAERRGFIAGYILALQEREAEVERLKEALKAIADEGYDCMNTEHHLTVRRWSLLAEKALATLTHPSPAPQQKVNRLDRESIEGIVLHALKGQIEDVNTGLKIAKKIADTLLIFLPPQQEQVMSGRGKLHSFLVEAFSAGGNVISLETSEWFEKNYKRFLSPAPQQEVSTPEVDKVPPFGKRNTSTEYIDRAITLLKDMVKDEWLVAGYNGVVSLLAEAKIANQEQEQRIKELEAQPSPTVQEPSTEQADSRNQWVKHFNPPFKHAEDSTFILDSHGNIVIEVRGWGHLSNLMTDIKACEVQDQIANHITDILNSSTEHKKEGGGQ